MNFSVIYNSRKRGYLLDGCFSSFLDNAKYPDLVNFLIKLDNDDLESIEICTDLKNKYKNLEFIVSPRPESLNESVSQLAFASNGRFIFGVNDDVFMITPDWDEIIIQSCDKFKEVNSVEDDILYIKTECTSVDRQRERGYASCPLISKEAINKLGIYLPHNFVGLGADSAIYNIYKEINRVVDCSEVLVDHLYHNDMYKVMNPDETSLEMRNNTYRNINKESDFNPNKYIEIFNSIIK